MAEDHFEKVYQALKLVITDAMARQGYGNVEVQLANIPGYLSEAWRDKAVTRLNEELVEEFGVKRVYFQELNLKDKKEPAFVVVG